MDQFGVRGYKGLWDSLSMFLVPFVWLVLYNEICSLFRQSLLNLLMLASFAHMTLIFSSNNLFLAKISQIPLGVQKQGIKVIAFCCFLHHFVFGDMLPLYVKVLLSLS